MRNTSDAHARDIHVLAITVGQQVNDNSLLGGNECSVVYAERRSPRREERLGRDDQSPPRADRPPLAAGTSRNPLAPGKRASKFATTVLAFTPFKYPGHGNSAQRQFG